MNRRYQLASRADLPARLCGRFSFREAHLLCCEWNRTHPAEDLAFPVPVKP